MIYTTQELYLKFKSYKSPHIKIATEVKNKRLFKIVRGLYSDSNEVALYQLANYVKQESYISFEYACSLYGFIPERVYTVTCATALENHTKEIKTSFGNISYSDISCDAYPFGVSAITEGEYTYLIASKEKAICDLLYKKPPVTSLKQLKILLFEDLRIDEDELNSCNKEEILFLCPLYKKKNLNFLSKYFRSL